MCNKVVDGLFYSSFIVVEDFEFLTSNKITHIINCSYPTVRNFWEKMGIQYLSLSWTNSLSCNIFDSRDLVIKKIVLFIEDSLDNAGTCLIHSENGNSRSVVCSILYLMCKFNWSVNKSLDFLRIKNCYIDIFPHLLNQLYLLEKRGIPNLNPFKSNDIEYITLQNTFTNSHVIPTRITSSVHLKRNKSVSWSEPLITNEDDVNVSNLYSHNTNLFPNTSISNESLYNGNIYPRDNLQPYEYVSNNNNPSYTSFYLNQINNSANNYNYKNNNNTYINYTNYNNNNNLIYDPSVDRFTKYRKGEHMDNLNIKYYNISKGDQVSLSTGGPRPKSKVGSAYKVPLKPRPVDTKIITQTLPKSYSDYSNPIQLQNIYQNNLARNYKPYSKSLSNDTYQTRQPMKLHRLMTPQPPQLFNSLYQGSDQQVRYNIKPKLLRSATPQPRTNEVPIRKTRPSSGADKNKLPKSYFPKYYRR